MHNVSHMNSVWGGCDYNFSTEENIYRVVKLTPLFKRANTVFKCCDVYPPSTCQCPLPHA